MYAMILAAGRGERMRPLTDTLPKPLLPVLGKPLIVYHLQKLAAAGYVDVVINQAWLGHELSAALGDGAKWHININYIDEGNQALETAGGIHNALPLLPEDYFLVVNGDIHTDFDFKLLPTSLPTGILAHLVMVDNPAHNVSGDFALTTLLPNSKQPRSILNSDGVSKLTFAGIGLYHRDLFSTLLPGAAPLGPLLRQAMAAKKITGQHHAGQWTDVGTPERLIKLEQELSSL